MRVKRILELFDKYDIHTTWATVGFLFASDIEELKVLSPEQKPSYYNTKLNPYKYISDSDYLEATSTPKKFVTTFNIPSTGVDAIKFGFLVTGAPVKILR